MKKKTSADFEAYIEKIIKKYASKLSLNHFIYLIEYNKDETDYLAMRFCYPYLKATIFYADESLEDFINGHDLEAHVLHELCHLITDPFYAKATDRYASKNEIEDERERLTDFICHLVFKTNN
jgi:hypothetical protein